MAVGRFSARRTQLWLQQQAVLPQWAALMTGDPTVSSDPLAVELLGASYRRPAVVWERVGQILRNTAPLVWATIPPQSRIAGVAGFDAPFNGNLEWWIPMDEPLDFPIGGSWSLDRDEVFLGVDS